MQIHNLPDTGDITKKMRPQRKLLTPALETRAFQLRAGTALMIDIMQTIREPLIALNQDLRLVEPKDFWSSSLVEAMPICCNISREGVRL